jgi:hypothetical protein
MPFGGKKGCVVTALVGMAMLVVVLRSADFGCDYFTTDAQTQKIMACLTSKGERVSAPAVKDWVTEFRDRYGGSDADSWVVAERVACRYW